MGPGKVGDRPENLVVPALALERDGVHRLPEEGTDVGKDRGLLVLRVQLDEGVFDVVLPEEVRQANAGDQRIRHHAGGIDGAGAVAVPPPLEERDVAVDPGNRHRVVGDVPAQAVDRDVVRDELPGQGRVETMDGDVYRQGAKVIRVPQPDVPDKAADVEKGELDAVA